MSQYPAQRLVQCDTVIGSVQGIHKTGLTELSEVKHGTPVASLPATWLKYLTAHSPRLGVHPRESTPQYLRVSLCSLC